MTKFWIRYGLGQAGEWEEIEAKDLDEAEDEAYRLALQDAEMEIDFEATDKKPEDME